MLTTKFIILAWWVPTTQTHTYTYIHACTCSRNNYFPEQLSQFHFEFGLNFVPGCRLTHVKWNHSLQVLQNTILSPRSGRRQEQYILTIDFSADTVPIACEMKSFFPPKCIVVDENADVFHWGIQLWMDLSLLLVFERMLGRTNHSLNHPLAAVLLETGDKFSSPYYTIELRCPLSYLLSHLQFSYCHISWQRQC